MTKFKSFTLAAVAVAVLAVACADGASEPITSPPAPTQSTRTPDHTSTQTGLQSAEAEFHAKNYLDFVGKAHNNALDEFFAATIATSETPGNFCRRVVEFMSESGRIPAGQNKGTPQQRRAYALRGLAIGRACSGRVTASGQLGLSLVTAAPGARTAATVDGVSATANSLLDQIGVAQTKATTAAWLASALASILAQADQLAVSAERDLVYAVASVAQSSYEYWVEQIAPQSQQVDVTYGPCLGKYSDRTYALSTCMGIPGGYTPTGYESPTTTPRVTLATFTQTDCGTLLSRSRIGWMDFGGAVAGGSWGLIGGPGGVVLGAINGGGVSSATESWAQFGAWAHCRRTGGGGGAGGTPPKPT